MVGLRILLRSALFFPLKGKSFYKNSLFVSEVVSKERESVVCVVRSVEESTTGGINNGCHFFAFIRGKSLRKHPLLFTVSSSFFNFFIFSFSFKT